VCSVCQRIRQSWQRWPISTRCDTAVPMRSNAWDFPFKHHLVPSVSPLLLNREALGAQEQYAEAKTAQSASGALASLLSRLQQAFAALQSHLTMTAGHVGSTPATPAPAGNAQQDSTKAAGSRPQTGAAVAGSPGAANSSSRLGQPEPVAAGQLLHDATAADVAAAWQAYRQLLSLIKAAAAPTAAPSTDGPPTDAS
jgi:hypothetical protein